MDGNRWLTTCKMLLPGLYSSVDSCKEAFLKGKIVLLFSQLLRLIYGPKYNRSHEEGLSRLMPGFVMQDWQM